MAPRRWSCLHLVFVVIVSVSVSVSTWVLADDSRLSWRSKNTTAGWRQFDDLRDEVAREEETLLEQRQLMREDRMDASSLGQLVVSPSTQASIRPVLGAPSTSSSLSTSRPPTIAVCIPATYGMYLMCHEAIFGQLAQYETMPTEFVISVSQVNGDVEENRLNEIEWEMRVKYPRAFNTSMKIFGRSGARSQGDNRNHAAEHTHSDLIAFFDSDDYAHPSRLRILVDTFRAQPDLDIIIHSYTRWETITEEVFKDYYGSVIVPLVWEHTPEDLFRVYAPYTLGTIPIKRRACCKLLGGDYFRVINLHNGWPTVKRGVWEATKYEQGEGRRQKGEDNRFLSASILKRFRLLGMMSDLAAYNHGKTTEKKCTWFEL